MVIYLDDQLCRQSLLPFSAVRHVAYIRAGILTLKEKWEHLMSAASIYLSPVKTPDTIIIPAHILPNQHQVDAIIKFYKHAGVQEKHPDFTYLNHPWDIFQLNDQLIRDDFMLLSKGRISQLPVSDNQLFGTNNIFIEEGATVRGAILNAETGPIYIGKHAQVMEGACIRGPFSLGEFGVVKMGSLIYGATSIGPYCVGGGEIKNSVLFGYSNKAHHGYLGDSVIGYWCNLGAGTTNSNVKNNGEDVSFQMEVDGIPFKAGQKAGLLMGDYTRTAVNTTFNTGTFVGISCHVFSTSFPPVNIPNFTWGDTPYLLDKALKHIDNWMRMKNCTLSTSEIEQLTQLYSNNK